METNCQLLLHPRRFPYPTAHTPIRFHTHNQPLAAACQGPSRRNLLELLALSYFQKGLANKVRA